MVAFARVSFAGVLVLAAVGCKARKPKATNHRAKAVACSAEKVPGDVEGRITDHQGHPLQPGDCAQDSDCTAGKNGRCAMSVSGRMASTRPLCVYDRCFQDSDCGNKSACVCGNAPYAGNHCMPGNCATDADCGGYGCSPSLGSCGNFSGYEGFFCHLPVDECTNDDECTKEAEGFCGWKPEVGKWQCQYSHCVG